MTHDQRCGAPPLARPRLWARASAFDRAHDASAARGPAAGVTSQRASRGGIRIAAALVLAGILAAGLLFWSALRYFALGGDGRGAMALLVERPTVWRNPRQSAPLVALLNFETHRPTRAWVEIDDGQRQWDYRPAGEPATQHRLAVLGLRPGRHHEFRVHVESPDGGASEVSPPLTLRTPPLPDDFPPLRTLVSQPERMEPGVTVFAANLWREGERIYDYGYVIALNSAGEVVWYLRTDRRIADLRLLDSGHLLYNEAGFRGVYEVDLLGNPIRRWWAAKRVEPPSDRYTPVEVDALHHDVLELPSGHLLGLSTELRLLSDFPASEAEPQGPTAEAPVVGDQIVEFTKQGRIVERLALLDLLDPHRIGYGSLSGFWSTHYPSDTPAGPSRDWSHTNALVYDADSGAVILSVRHQDCLVKIDRATRRIEWILGDPEGWRPPWRDFLLRPSGPLQWPYHQHGPQLTSFGTLMLYDNGNYRALPPQPKRPATENHSRVVEYEIDEENMSVRQVWEYSGAEGESFYSPFYGEADRLPKTGNVLVTDGGRIETHEGVPEDEIPSDHQWARIVEVTHDEPAETVFEVVLDSGLGSDIGWSIYRSERLPEMAVLSEIATRSRRHR